MGLDAQHLEGEGKAKITVMDKDDMVDSVVVRQADGTLAVRDVSSLPDTDPANELQVLSISNDTIFLSNGGFAKLPTDQVDDAAADPTNELQNWGNLPGIPAGIADGDNQTIDKLNLDGTTLEVSLENDGDPDYTLDLSSLQGSGPPGADGADGIDGAQGLPGIDGADGINGIDGTNGIDGAQGNQGIPGEDGIDGADGAQDRPGVV